MPMSAAARPGSMPPPVARSSALLGMRSGAPTGRIPLGRSEMMRGPEILPQTPGPYIAKGSVPMPTAGLPRGLPIARPSLHGPGGCCFLILLHFKHNDKSALLHYRM